MKFNKPLPSIQRTLTLTSCQMIIATHITRVYSIYIKITLSLDGFIYVAPTTDHFQKWYVYKRQVRDFSRSFISNIKWYYLYFQCEPNVFGREYLLCFMRKQRSCKTHNPMLRARKKQKRVWDEQWRTFSILHQIISRIEMVGIKLLLTFEFNAIK